VTLTDVGVVPGCVEDLHAGEILQDFSRKGAKVPQSRKEETTALHLSETAARLR